MTTRAKDGGAGGRVLCTCWTNRTPHPFSEQTCANELHPERVAPVAEPLPTYGGGGVLYPREQGEPRIVAECWTCKIAWLNDSYGIEFAKDCRAAGHDVRPVPPSSSPSPAR